MRTCGRETTYHGPLSLPLGELAVRAASRNQRVGRALLQGVHMLKSPAAALGAPEVLARIILYSLRELVIGPPRVQLRLPAAPTPSRATLNVDPLGAQRAG